jgi:hypothetical protein
MLGGALKAAQVPDNPMESAFVEQLFSLEPPDGGAPVEVAATDSETLIKWNGKLLVAFSTDRVEVPPVERDAFVRFVRHRFGGHPHALRLLSEGSGIPRRLTITRPGMGVEATRLVLENRGEVEDQCYTLDGKKRVLVASKLEGLLEEAYAGGPSKLEERSANILEHADVGAAGDKPVEAMLAYQEFMLMTGSVESRNDALSQLVGLPEVREALTAIQPPDGSGIEEAIKVLQALQQEMPSRRAVLRVFEANHQLAAKRPDAAKTLFIAALKENPFIVGAWKDLGELFVRAFETPTGWDCFDVARYLRPDHFLLEGIKRYEKELVFRHPAFF